MLLEEDENIKEVVDEVQEEPIEPVEYHVYGTEVPGNSKIEVHELGENKFATIIATLAEAKKGDTIIVHEGI